MIDVSSFSPSSEWIDSDEGLKLQIFYASLFALLTLCFSVSLSHLRSTKFLSKLNPQNTIVLADRILLYMKHEMPLNLQTYQSY